MLYLVQALVFLLDTVLAAAGMKMTLSSDAQPPVGATPLGSAPALALPTRPLRLTRGTGPTLHTYWTGYWTLAS